MSGHRQTHNGLAGRVELSRVLNDSNLRVVLVGAQPVDAPLDINGRDGRVVASIQSLERRVVHLIFLGLLLEMNSVDDVSG